VGVNANAIIPTGPNGHPLYRFCICVVAAVDFAKISAVTNLYLFPDQSLDTLMSAMQSDPRTGLVQSVQAYDLDGQGMHLDATNADSASFRDLMNKIGRQFDTAFNADRFGVAEVAR
jgi:hypothetical protein